MIYNNFKMELMDYLKDFNPVLKVDKTEESIDEEESLYETSEQFEIEILRKDGLQLEIKYKFSTLECKDDPDFNGSSLESCILFAGVRIGDLRYETFEPIKTIFEDLFNNKTCILIAELNGQTEARAAVNEPYTKEMHMRRIPIPLQMKSPFSSIKEIKKFYKDHGTIKVIYWDNKKSFEYKVFSGKHPTVH